LDDVGLIGVSLIGVSLVGAGLVDFRLLPEADKMPMPIEHYIFASS